MKRDDNGQVSVLIVGFFAILIVLVGVVVDASAAFLQRAALTMPRAIWLSRVPKPVIPGCERRSRRMEMSCGCG